MSPQPVLKSDIVRVEKQPPQGVALLAKPDQWGNEKYGYQTQLITTSKNFRLGKPIAFHLVAKNMSHALRMISGMSVVFDVLIIKDSHGKKAPYKVSSLQVEERGKPLDAGDTDILFQDRDIR